MSDSAQIAGATTRAELTALLASWLPAQRWFATKGAEDMPDDDAASRNGSAAGDLVIVGALALDDEDADPGVQVVDLLVSASGVTYQVPLTVHWTPDLELSRSLIGVLHGEDGPRWVYDGPHDPAFVRAWLLLLTNAPTFSTPSGPSDHSAPSNPAVIMQSPFAAWDAPALSAHGVVPSDGLPVDPETPSTVLRGEQSNTSVIVGAQSPNPLIVKLFRVVAPGDNPDVVIQSALAAAGSTRVPRPAGWVEATWHPLTDTAGDGSAVTGHLAFACEFIPGSEDAWRVALRAIAEGASFADSARELGAATAQVHRVLSEVMPRTAATPELLGSLADALVARVDWALDAAPVLAPYAAAARDAVDAVRSVAHAPDLQQVHGDYHLGQVLHSAARGWVLLDFEGEPLRPLAERMRPDLALRDVAGMLRSFDYAARHVTIGLADDDPAVVAAQRWVDDAREAFLAGYAEVSGRDPRDDATLLRALELDKALYEVVYEVGNRPTWVPIPMSAVRRLLPTP